MPGLELAWANLEAPAQPAKPSRPPHSKPKSKLFLAFDPIPPHDALTSTRDIDRCGKYNWPASGLQSTFHRRCAFGRSWRGAIETSKPASSRRLAEGRGNARRGSAAAGSQVVRMPGPQ